MRKANDHTSPGPLTPAPDAAAPRWLERIPVLRTGPLRLGFLATIGVLLALVLGGAINQLVSVLTLLFLAIFISMGLHPLVVWLQRRGIPKTGAILIVVAAFLAVVAAMLLVIVPIVVREGAELGASLPGHIAGIETQPWFVDLNSRFDGYPTVVLQWLRGVAADPNTWVLLGGGAIGIVANVINGTFSVLFVLVVSLYFVASLETMKQALYELVPGSQVARFKELTEEIVESIGRYLGGQVVLATITGVVSFLVMTIAGLPYAAVVAFLGLLLALIPVVGDLMVTVLMTVIALFVSPVTAIIVAIIMVIYMQVEAYIVSPRIIGKAIDIPASLVLIGAVTGGAIGGLLGALVAAPVAASILLVIKKVIVPAQRVR